MTVHTARPGEGVHDFAGLRAHESRRGSARRWAVLVTVSVAAFIAALDHTALNVALPTIERELDASLDELAWVVDAYMLAFASLLLTAGGLADRFGRKLLFVMGLLTFGATSYAATLAGSPEALIASRLAMGVGVALLGTAGLATLRHVFKENLGAATGIYAAATGLGVAVGPVAGGWLVEEHGWEAIFLINLPVVALAVTSALWLLPESRPADPERLDVVGAVLCSAGLGALVWGTIEAGPAGWTATRVLVAMGAGAALLAVFGLWEASLAARGRRPMLPGKLFVDRRFRRASGADFLTYFGALGGVFVLAWYFQAILEYDPFGAGLALVPVAVGLLITSPLTSALAERGAGAAGLAVGLGLIAAAGWGLSTVTAQSDYWWPAGVCLFGVGLGMGAVVGAATHEVTRSLAPAQEAAGVAVDLTGRQTGAVFGVAVYSAVLGNIYRDRIAGAVADLSPESAELASEGVGPTLRIASTLGPDRGSALALAGREAFIDAMGLTTMYVLVPVAVAGMLLIAWGARPRRSGRHHEGPVPHRVVAGRRAPATGPLAFMPGHPSHRALELSAGVHCPVRGDGDGPLVVIVGGLGSLEAHWSDVSSRLTELGYLVALPTMPWAPGGPFLRGERIVPEVREVFDGLLARLSRSYERPIVLVGHSLGGALALTYVDKPVPAVNGVLAIAPAGLDMNRRRACLFAVAGAVLNPAAVRAIRTGHRAVNELREELPPAVMLRRPYLLFVKDDPVVLASSADLGAFIGAGKEVLGSGRHSVQINRPDAVAAWIDRSASAAIGVPVRLQHPTRKLDPHTAPSRHRR